MRTVHFTHTDLDGAGCAILLEVASSIRNPKTGIIFYLNNGSPQRRYFVERGIIFDSMVLESIQNDDIIIITDITPSKYVMEELRKYYNETGKVIVVDHHRTDMDEQFMIIHYDEHLKGYPDIQTSATSILADLLVYKVNHQYSYDMIFLMVGDIRDWDTFRWTTVYGINNMINFNVPDLPEVFQEKTRSYFLNVMLNTFGMDIFIDMMTDMIMNLGAFTQLHYDIWINHIRRIRSVQETLRTTTKIIDFEGYKCGVILDSHNLSENLNFICRELDVDISLGVNVSKGTVSIRTNSDDISVYEIAKKYGGGGHTKASGFPLNNLLSPMDDKKLSKTVRNMLNIK